MNRFRNGITFFLIVLLHAASIQLVAQNNSFTLKNISTADGLPENSAFDVLQDHIGFIWIGTQNGLVRYDGYSFITFYADSSESGSLSSGDIYDLCEDHQGNIWIGTRDAGVNLYNRDTERFIHFQHDSDDSSSISSNVIVRIYADALQNLWVGTSGGGLNKLVVSDSPDSAIRFEHFKFDSNDVSSISSNEIWSIGSDPNEPDRLWIGTGGGGLNEFDTKHGHFRHYRYDPTDIMSLSNDSVSVVQVSKSGAIWLGTNGGGLNRFDPASGVFERYEHNPQNLESISDNYILTILEDETGNLWVGTALGGLNYFDLSSKTFQVQQLASATSSREELPINSAYRDQFDNLWFGTWLSGLNKLDRYQNKFTHYQKKVSTPNTLSSNHIYSIMEDSAGNLWIGTVDEGLNKFDRETKVFTHYKKDSLDAQSLHNNAIRSLMEDSRGYIWIGTDDGGLNRLDPATDQMLNFTSELLEFSIPAEYRKILTNYSIAEDNQGQLWIASRGAGVFRLDPTDNSIEQYAPNPESAGNLPSGLNYEVSCSNAGTIWVGGERGVSRYDPQTNRFEVFEVPGEALVVYERSPESLWVGTYYKGLFHLNPMSGALTSFAMPDGLPHRSVWGILEDSSGYLWLSTGKGISSFDPVSKTFRNYDKNDGLQGNDFNSMASFRSPRTGEMFFGGTNGFNSFYPDKIQDDPHPPKIVITDFRLFNQSVSAGEPDSPLSRSITVTDSITLTHSQYIFSFELTALHFSNPEKNQYAYKMEGLEENWNEVGTQRIATYSNLGAGRYTFKAKAANSDGVWTEEVALIQLTVLPPWWQTWWAYSLYFFLLFAAVSVLRRYELNRQLLKHQTKLQQVEAEKLQELDAFKSRFFANISHEFRTPLTLIQGPLKMLLSGEYKGDAKKHYKLMLRSTERLLRLVNQVLDLSKLEARRLTLDASVSDFGKFVKMIVLSFSSRAEERDISLDMDVPATSLNAYFDREKMEQVLYNLLSNAFKFTPEGGAISVAVGRPDSEVGNRKLGKGDVENSAFHLPPSDFEWVSIRVSDSGIGIPADRLQHIFDRFYQVDSEDSNMSSPGTGIGLALTKELVELHGGSISVESVVGEGTTFLVCMPVLIDQSSVFSQQSSTNRGSDKSEVGGWKSEVGSRRLENGSGQVEPGDVDNSAFRVPPSELAEGQPIVLIVEDDADVRSFICEQLRELYVTDEAKDGLEGLNRATERIPDLIVSDVMMPKMNGFELCERLKSGEATSHIPVVLLTARAADESKIEGLETGADDYLIKPFDANELRVRVKNLIEQREKLRERFSRDVTLKPQEVAITPVDEVFLNRLMETMEHHLAEEGFSVEDMCKEVGLSRTQLHRKLKALTNQSTTKFMRTFRLQRAMEMLRKKAGTISDIAYATGFSSLTYFTRSFKEFYGFVPSEVYKNDISGSGSKQRQ